MNELTHIDLFSGIGGFSLAAGWAGFKTIAFCEIESFCQEVLKARFGAVADTSGANCCQQTRQADPRGEVVGRRDHEVRVELGGHNADGPLLIPDIFALDGTRFRGATLLTGGFPCQPFSHAGKRRGKEDDRAIWPQMLRVIHEARPTWVIGENVSGLISMELDQVLADLELEGYAARTFHIGAVGVNAPHRRMRVWIVAQNTIDDRDRIRESQEQGHQRDEAIAPDYVGDTEGTRQQGGILGQGENEFGRTDSWDIPWIEVATRFCRVDDGLPPWIHARRVARLKALGNAIVPQVAYQIIKAIAEIEENR